MDKQYEILDHPADLKIRSSAESLPGVFVNLAKAIGQQQFKLEGQKAKEGDAEEIVIEADDLESFLVSWLSEILYRSEAKKKVYTDFEITEFSQNPFKIAAKINGVPVSRKMIDIKGVTFHDLQIKKIGDGWEGIVLFDI